MLTQLYLREQSLSSGRVVRHVYLTLSILEGLPGNGGVGGSDGRQQRQRFYARAGGQAPQEGEGEPLRAKPPSPGVGITFKW